MRWFCIALVCALAACGPTERAETPPPPSSEAAMPVDPPAYVGGWAVSAADCADPPWRFNDRGVATRGEVACTFNAVLPTADGYEIAAMCTVEAPPAPYAITLRFPDSEDGVRRMHAEGAPWAAPDLVACE